MDIDDRLSLLDWKRRIAAVYAEVRADDEPARAWERWRTIRDDLFKNHPQSPIPAMHRHRFTGLEYFDYNPAARVLAETETVDPLEMEITTSGSHPYAFTRFAVARFDLHGSTQALELLWLRGYGGGLYLSFRDATSGTQTYGGGRYLLDTVKGADLGTRRGKLVLDFNFSYNPSCAYDPRWVCPLAPPANRLKAAVEAGELDPPSR